MSPMQRKPCPVSKQLETLGFSLVVASPHYVEDKKWAHVASTCVLSHNGAGFWSGEFRQGLACLDKETHTGTRYTVGQQRMRENLQGYRKPTLAEVLNCILLDGACADELFPDWCASLGYSDDSIKARDIYDTCQRIAKDLRKVPADVLTKARELLADY